MSSSPVVRRTVDARGSLCPLPTVKAALALEELQKGEILELLADDPATRRDLPGWCRERGHSLLTLREDGEFFHILIQKEGTP